MVRMSGVSFFFLFFQVCFSADGEMLAVACEDKSHTVMVFRWEAGVLRCQARLGVKKALSLCFSLNGDELVAAGHKHFKVKATWLDRELALEYAMPQTLQIDD